MASNTGMSKCVKVITVTVDITVVIIYIYSFIFNNSNNCWIRPKRVAFGPSSSQRNAQNVCILQLGLGRERHLNYWRLLICLHQ